MAQSLTDIKHRIASVKSTKQITKAMRMVSAAKMNQVQKHYDKYLDYETKLRQIASQVARSELVYSISENAGDLGSEGYDSIYFDRTEEVIVNSLVDNHKSNKKKTAYLVVTSDRGLVGSYNSSILKATLNLIKESSKDNDQAKVFCVGSVGSDFFQKRDIEVALTISDLSDNPSYGEVKRIISKIVEQFENRVFDELYVCYNHFANALTSTFRVERVLPLSDLEIFSEENNKEQISFLSEPSPVAVIDTVLPQYAEGLIYGSILDAKLAEHSASTMAMKSATDNADDLINHLSIQYNRARQSAITTEINEIVGGAAALE